MQALVEEALDAGAIGVSTGLAYAPAVASTTEEIIEICRPLAKHGSIYCSHIRDEGDTVMESLDEAFRVGREVGVPVVISHHKVVGTQNHGRSVETLNFISEQMKKQPICLDCYPYAASSTILSPELCRNATRVIITWSKSLPDMAGKDLVDIQVEMGLSREETIERLQPAGAIFFRMDDADVQRILQFDETMIGSDGLPHDKKPHPRLWGSFPRVLGHYSRGLGLFALEKAVHKMTGLTAARFGLTERGVIKEGAFADLTVFNAETIDEGGSYLKPVTPSVGIELVVVNGTVVWRDGKPSGARPGKVLRRAAMEVDARR